MLDPVEKEGRYHHGDLRQALIDASLALIEDGGVQALSLRKAARKAGVSPGAPYHHFPSRSALLAAIAIEGFERLHAKMDEAREGLETASERLGSCGRAYIAFARENPAHFRVMFRPELADPSEFAELRAIGDPVFGLLVQTVKDGQEAGVVPAGDTEAMVILAWSMAHGLSSLILDGPLGGDEFDKVEMDAEQLPEAVVGALSRLFHGAAAFERDAGD